MVKFIYGTTKPYITQDEHKINEDELKLLEDVLNNPTYRFFMVINGRLSSTKTIWTAKFDRMLLAFLPTAFKRKLAGRVLLFGTITK